MSTNYSDIVGAALGEQQPYRTKRGALKYQPPDADWSLNRLGELKDFYQSTYKRPLPLANIGQGSVHNRLGYDHRSSADVSLNPTTAEGQSLIAELQRRNIPFLAFDRAIPGVATGPHIHVGRPSHRMVGKFNVGSQVKRPTKAVGYDDIITAATEESGYDDVVSAASKPAKPGIVEALTAVANQANQITGNVERASRAGVGELRRIENWEEQEVRDTGIGKLRRIEAAEERANQDTGVGRLRRLDAPALAAQKQVEAEVRAERGLKNAIGMPQTLNPITAVSNYLAGKNEEQLVREETDRRLQAGYAEQGRLREIASQFTENDKRQLANAVTAMRGEGSARRGISTGAQRVTSGLLYKIAALTDIAGSPGTPAFPNYLGDYLRRKAGAGEMAVQEIEELPQPVRQQLADFITHAVGGLPEIVGATAAAGPVGGFAALGGLEAAGRKQPFGQIAKETAKGAVIGGVFQGASAFETGAQTTGGRAADIARSGAAIGLGTAAVEKAFGADDYDAARAAASNVLFHAGMRVPGEIGRFAQAAETALKRPPGEAAPTVTDALQKQLDALASPVEASPLAEPTTEVVPPRTPAGSWRVRVPLPDGTISTESFPTEAEAYARARRTPPTSSPSESLTIPPAENMTPQPPQAAGLAVSVPTSPSRRVEVKVGGRQYRQDSLGDWYDESGGKVDWPELIRVLEVEQSLPALPERRGPSRLPEADWLELTPKERAAISQQVDTEMAPRRPLTELMRERAETGPKESVEVPRYQVVRGVGNAYVLEDTAMEMGDRAIRAGTDKLALEAEAIRLNAKSDVIDLDAEANRPTAADQFARQKVGEMLGEPGALLHSEKLEGELAQARRGKISFKEEQEQGARQADRRAQLEQRAADGDEAAQHRLLRESLEEATDLTHRDIDAGPTKPRKPPKDQGGFIDLTEVLAGLQELHAKFPDKSEREVRALLPSQHRELLDREQPLHSSSEQPRTPTGQFSLGEPGGPEAARSLLRTEARKYAQQYKALDYHSARRSGLDIVNDDIARNYFAQLRRLATEHLPAQAVAVDQAESLYSQGKYSQATMLAESVFGALPDKVNQYSAAMAAMQLTEMGVEAKTNWSKVLQEVRDRIKRTGGLSGGGSTFYDVNKRPEGGRPDHAKIAYILEPVVEALRADAARLISEGKLKTADYVAHVRTEAIKMLAGSDFNDWHPLNKSAALGELAKQLHAAGIPSAPVEPQQRNRSLPSTLERSGRDPGTNLTYGRLPNAVVNERVETRLAADGPETLEAWYRAAPESADRTAAHRVLVDHYTARAVELADTAPQQAEVSMQHARDLSNLEAERSTTMGQAVQMYSNLLKYTAPGVLREISSLEAKGVKVPAEAVTKLVKAAKAAEKSDQAVRRLEREVREAEVEAGEAPPVEPGEQPRPRRYTPRQRTASPEGAEAGGDGPRGPADRAERARRRLDEAAQRRRAERAAIAAQLRALEQSRTVTGYYRRSINITRGLMVSALSTAMRNLQSQAVRFDVERLVDATEHTIRRTVGLDSDLTYRNIWRNTARQFRLGQMAEAREILTAHPGELARMFNNYAGGVDVPIPGNARGAVERAFQTVERGVEIANVFNRLQEFHIRSAEFLAELDLHLRREHNQTLEQYVQRNGIDAIPLELVRRATNKALEVTFADMPARDGAGGRFLTSMIEVGNYIPPTLSPVAFPRFMFNNLKFLYQHSPAGMLDLARRNQNAPRVISRALVGTSLLLLAYQFRKSDHAGEKWYELRFNNPLSGKEVTLDARPFGPFSTYLFMAEAIRRQANGEKAFTLEEIAGAVGASTGPGGTALDVSQKLYDYAANGKWDKWQRVLKTEAGEWGRALLTPVRQVKDLIAAFDASQAVNRDTSLEPGLGPIKESIPYADTNLPPAQIPTTATPIHQERPATKALTGWRVETPKTFIQRELDSLNFTSREIRPATGIPAIDQLEKRLMGPLMDQLSAELEKDAEYGKLSRKARAVYLRDFIADIREEVRELGKAEHPELYEQLQEERKPRRQREFEQEENSPGLSKAIRLGVPMSIPPPRPGEDDIAYRARLLQLGRQRRQRLDSVYDSSLPANALRTRLYESLYSG